MSGAGELWQAYDEQGEPLVGKGLTKPQARSGILHGASHVWIWRGSGGKVEVLMQKRADTKPTWPGYYDISAAGHIDLGETPLQAALRETKEEIGLDLDTDMARPRLLFVHHAYLIDGGQSGAIENEFQWVYGWVATKDLAVSHHDGEVAATAWIRLDDFKRLINRKVPGKRVVPHGEAYFMNLLEEIEHESGWQR